MQPFSPNPGVPPGIFDHGGLRDVVLDPMHNRERAQTHRDAAQVPLPPPSPLEQGILSAPTNGTDDRRGSGGKPRPKDSQPGEMTPRQEPSLPTDTHINDILTKIPNLFRLLDLYQENGSGGLVEKVLIDQGSLCRFLNTLQPGSYESVSKINFKVLDDLSIKPLGVYGSKLEIIKFLRGVACLDDESERALSLSIATPNDLRSGLYLILPLQASIGEVATHRAYIVYWPEDSTWEDNAISSVRRNRVTFIRYLSKLTDQTVALISPRQAKAMVWTPGSRNTNPSGGPIENFEVSRMFSFEVAKSIEQDEDAIATKGFKILPDQRGVPGIMTSENTCLVPGEEAAGLLLSVHKPARKVAERFSVDYYPIALRSMVESKKSPIVLGNLSAEELAILGRHGLRELYPQPFIKYDKRLAQEGAERKEEYDLSIRVMEEKFQQDKPLLRRVITLLIRINFARVYPSVRSSVDSSELESPEFAQLRNKYRGLNTLPEFIKKESKAHIIDEEEFNNLKLAWRTIREYLLSEPVPPEDRQIDFIKQVLGIGDDGGEWTTVTKKSRNQPGFKLSFRTALASLFGYDAKPPSKELSDPDFVQSLQPLASAYPTLLELTDRIIYCLQSYLEQLGTKLLKRCYEKVTEAEAERLVAIFTDERRARERAESAIAASALIHDLNLVMPSNPSNATRVMSVEVEPSRYGSSPRFRVRGETIKERKARTGFTIHPFALTERDVQQCRASESYVPEPRFSTRYFQFDLEEEHRIEFLQLIRDKCLVILAGPGAFRLYIEDSVRLLGVIERQNSKLVFNYERMGESCIFALDEGSRLLAIFHTHEGPKLSIYSFDETFSSIRARGSPFSLREWYDSEVHIEKMCFVSKSDTEEICLIDSSGYARILSLVTLHFRPASVQIDGKVVDASSSPDGSCLLASVLVERSTPPQHKLLVFHWASFGSNQSGICPTVLPASDGGRVVTSFEGRNRIHLLSFSSATKTTRSVALQIKQKATEFSFRSNQPESTSAASKSINNCLLDCHSEVWTRFPVLPAVSRSTLSSLGREPRKLVFSSTVNLGSLDGYFARMISAFEQSTGKPIDRTLSSVSFVSSSDPPDVLVQNTPCSKYQLGSFIVEFICLIPLHLAITRDNRFIPLKDGVWDAQHERSLLGADVPAIIDALSIGWYEPVFQSYMATKPVRVVSSMGEQSVGKSYCLNHFADTTFAGSAMRTTEGVWLSCTPTDDYLLVSLDFEGVHSIERSAQEDALLVLFNTAISNLVLFRNNFALSRDIAGLFTSFQSSAMVLDPRANPGLFNSTLAIIIKDVTDSDSKDIVKEFSLKFQKIVQKEQEQNFISRLHRGKIQIIPWPVINSPGFYTLFHHLRRYLDSQPISHPSGGVFLHNLKTLMAKIKASDWGSLDQNLVAHRALQINERLQNALSRGQTEQGADMWEPLKNFDSDEAVLSSGLTATFFVPDTAGNFTMQDEIIVEQMLGGLIDAYAREPTIGPRHVVGDRKYVDLVQKQLFQCLDRRLEDVRHWVQVNVERFPPENQDIRNILNKIDSSALGMRAAVQLCSETCSSCHYLCLRPHRHSGAHHCGTTHRCEFPCEVTDEHPSPVECGLPAGHSARHMCDIKAHSCGGNCHLIDKSGCAHSCVKPLDHTGEHLCSARTHSCGELCSFLDANSGYQCQGRCRMPWDEAHTRHECNNSNSCPIECQLCRRLCCEPDHFHGMDPTTVHLCGQGHPCTSLCAADGICRIETQPSTVEEQFSGRHQAFQYTKYRQVEQRLTCVIQIPPGELQHEGRHIHSTDKDVFHYCDVRCPSCQYLCTLPLGHAQQLHETSHGSMTATQWVIQGADQNAIYELDGRKFGVGDEGAPMLCHMLCAAQGRHAHIDFCRDPHNCQGPDWKHINERMHPHVDRPKDWISHRLLWARNGFQDPYSREQQTDFAKCDSMCSGPEHQATATAAAAPSYCNLAIFHPPRGRDPAPANGYVSVDGHSFDCPNPARLHQSYHIVFVIDSSGSMTSGDRGPLPNTPVSARLRAGCNNRYGAVLSALYDFWHSRESANANGQPRSDAYTVVTFNNSPTTRVSNNFTSTADQLINQLLANSAGGGTNFNSALAHAQSLIRTHWSSDRVPALVFLSDGECSLNDNVVHDLCRMCVQLGKPLALFSVSFGNEGSSASLRRMAEIARTVYSSAPQDPRNNLARNNPCAYHIAVDSIQLATTFLGISSSLQKPRASLLGQRATR